MMSTSTLLFLIASSQFLISVQGLLTMRLKGKEMIPRDGKVNITDLPILGCRRYDTLECLSDVPYRGKVEKAYWNYTDPDTLKDYEVDDIRCEGKKDCWKFGWQSNLGLYKKGKEYHNVVRLGRRFENATVGHFTCHFEGDSGLSDSISVNIVCSALTAPTEIKVTDFRGDNESNIHTTISWNAPCGGVDFYTFYYANPLGADQCHNKTFDADVTSHTVINVNEIQIVAHRNDMAECSKVQKITFGSYELSPMETFSNGCGCDEE